MKWHTKAWCIHDLLLFATVATKPCSWIAAVHAIELSFIVDSRSFNVKKIMARKFFEIGHAFSDEGMYRLCMESAIAQRWRIAGHSESRLNGQKLAAILRLAIRPTLPHQSNITWTNHHFVLHIWLSKCLLERQTKWDQKLYWEATRILSIAFAF